MYCKEKCEIINNLILSKSEVYLLLKVFRLNKEPPAGGRGNAPLELDSWPVCGNCPAPVPPAGARKSTFILPAHKGRRCESAFELLSHQKVTKRLPER